MKFVHQWTNNGKQRKIIKRTTYNSIRWEGCSECLWNLGYKSISDLKNQDAEEIYVRHNDLRGQVQDICMLYTFRCAVYFANTFGDFQEPEKLKWWYWTDEQKVDSKTKDEQIRKQKTCR